MTVALDNNKNAQANAISAFGSLAKEVGPTGALDQYLQAISQAFVAAFSKYQSKNVLKLYETISHLSDGVGPGGLSDPAVLDSLMQPIIQRWQATADEDAGLLHLLGVSFCAQSGFAGR
jgi:transportin-1